MLPLAKLRAALSSFTQLLTNWSVLKVFVSALYFENEFSAPYPFISGKIKLLPIIISQSTTLLIY